MLKLKAVFPNVLIGVLGWASTVQAQNLRSLFSTEQPGFNVSLVLPGEPPFANDTKPCKWILRHLKL